MKTPLATYLAGLVLTCSTLHAADIMTGTYDPAPTDKNKSLIDKLLVYAYDGDGNKLPLKTLKITNLNPTAVYPIMRDSNEAALAKPDDGTGLYDPYDAVRTEYRGYIGYKGTDNKFHYGLQPGQSILIRMPLVFWNGVRMGILTENTYLAAAREPNPTHYNTVSTRIIVNAETDASDTSLIKNGVVGWYKASPAEAFALDNQDQLLEWTARDATYLANPQITARTKGQIPSSEKVTLLNYDVSYVDNLYLPLAMEALNVPIPRAPYPPGRKPQPYGWVGSVGTSRDLQAKFAPFIKTGTALLGSYFPGKQGWPKYNIPGKSLKIPAGQNIFLESPLGDIRSSYNNDVFSLSSGGDGNTLVRVSIGGEGTASSGYTVTLTPSVDLATLEFLKKGYDVIGNPPLGKANPIQPGTKIVSVTISLKKGVSSTVQLSKPLIATQDGCTFDFFRPRTDYAATAMTKLWYSWAEYYVQDKSSTPTHRVAGSVIQGAATLTFNAAHAGLFEGMQVTGPGVPPPDPSSGAGGAIILQIAGDKKSLTLSNVAASTTSGTYTFLAPQPLPSTPSKLYTFNFLQDPKEPQHVPAEFAKQIYVIMACMAQIPNNNSKFPRDIQLMANVVGGNFGFIFEKGGAVPTKGDPKIISAVMRDILKSVLRGVTDFTRFPEFDLKQNQLWYPTPSVPRGGLVFNAYNLDPFVWFVHDYLGLSGYGFSLDDDTADVGAGQATRLLLTIGGSPTGKVGPVGGTITAPENPNEWAIQAPYGPIVAMGHWDPNKTDISPLNITGATNTSPIVITSVDHNLRNGDTIFIDEVKGNTAANSVGGKPFTVENVTPNTFALVGTTGNGAYVGGGRWFTGRLTFLTFTEDKQDSVYWRLMGDDRVAGFQGALVTGKGVKVKGTVRIQKLGKPTECQLLLNTTLLGTDGQPLLEGDYKWTFYGK